MLKFKGKTKLLWRDVIGNIISTRHSKLLTLLLKTRALIIIFPPQMGKSDESAEEFQISSTGVRKLLLQGYDTCRLYSLRGKWYQRTQLCFNKTILDRKTSNDKRKIKMLRVSLCVDIYGFISTSHFLPNRQCSIGQKRVRVTKTNRVSC